MKTVSQAAQEAFAAFAHADLVWDDELRRLYGDHACNIRYLPAGKGRPGSHLRHLFDDRAKAQAAWNAARQVEEAARKPVLRPTVLDMAEDALLAVSRMQREA